MKTQNLTKRLFALLLAVMMVLSMAACGGSEDPNPSSSGTQGTEPGNSGTPTDPSESEPTVPTDPKVEANTYDYSSEEGQALSISNVMPDAFSAGSAVKIEGANYNQDLSVNVSSTTEKDVYHYYNDYANLEAGTRIVYNFTVSETGTYDLCVDLRMKDSQHRYSKITVDAGTASEFSFVMDYEIPEDTIDLIRDDTWSSFLAGYSLDLAAGDHTLTITLAKTESHKTAHFRNFYLIGADTNAAYVAKVNDTWYENFAVAMIAADEATSDVTVTMFADASSPNTVTMKGSNNVTLNGNGYTYTSTYTEKANNQAFVLQKTAGELTIQNIHFERDSKKFVFRIDTPAVVNLIDISINADNKETDAGNEGVIYFKEWEDINLNMTRVTINLDVATTANSDTGTGCKGGIITAGYDKNDATKTVNITMVDCYLDATKSPSYAGISVPRGVTLNLSLTNTTILTGDEYALLSRSRADLAGKAIINATLSGECVIQAANADYNNSDGYSYGGGINPVAADITLKVE